MTLTKAFLARAPGKFTPLTWQDYDGLMELLRAAPKSRDSMAHSAGYFLHTGRKGLWYAEDGLHKALVSLHPNKEHQLLIFPVGGDTSVQYWASLSDYFVKASFQVSLARVTPEMVLDLDTAGFSEVTETVLDWRFPVTIVDTELVARAEGATFLKFRAKVKRAQRNDTIHVVENTDSRFPALMPSATNMIERWARSVSEVKNFSVSHLVDSNRSALEVSMRAPVKIQCRLYVAAGRVIGMTALELPVGSDTANGIAQCVDREWPGCSEFMYREDAIRMSNFGYRYYNINGAETASLDQFRRKLRPVNRISLATFVRV